MLKFAPVPPLQPGPPSHRCVADRRQQHTSPLVLEWGHGSLFICQRTSMLHNSKPSYLKFKVLKHTTINRFISNKCWRSVPRIQTSCDETIRVGKQILQTIVSKSFIDCTNIYTMLRQVSAEGFTKTGWMLE